MKYTGLGDQSLNTGSDTSNAGEHLFTTCDVLNVVLCASPADSLPVCQLGQVI